ncbi:unnamed protein product [Paramecium pentaurelia]|uniref:Uncharacterized protein n=1 Tax=Paramecium pentaurelia TaxID=43138 RepID=A0A8S1WEC4_9CILI|nr:unnamed protein product [Paramecium pentaurelia]
MKENCTSDSQILVMEGSNKTQWNIRQRISVDQWRYRLFFINNHVFTFQPIEAALQLQGSAHIHIFIYNTQKEQYLKSKTLLIQGGGQHCRPQIPQLYLDSINLLLSKMVIIQTLIDSNSHPPNLIWNGFIYKFQLQNSREIDLPIKIL